MKISEVLSEAFGANDDKSVNYLTGGPHAFAASKAIPPGIIEYAGQALFVAAGLYGMVKGASLGVSFIDSSAGGALLGKLLSGGFFGLLGGGLGGLLGAIPSSIAVELSPSMRKRQNYIKDRAKEIAEYPNIKNELSTFVHELVSQTPDVLIDNRDAINIVNLLRASKKQSLKPSDEGFEIFEDLVNDVLTYFSFKEKEWQQIAKKYNISGEDLREVYNYLYPNVPIENLWLSNLKDNIRINSLKPKEV
jgi:hypothetical protein